MARIDIFQQPKVIRIDGAMPSIQIQISKREAMQIVNGHKNVTDNFMHDLQKAINWIENKIEPDA